MNGKVRWESYLSSCLIALTCVLCLTSPARAALSSKKVDDAFESIRRKIEEHFAAKPIRVSAVDGTRLYVDLGYEDSFLSKGDQFQIILQGNVIRDPSTGEILGKSEEKLGTATVNTIRKDYAILSAESSLEDKNIEKLRIRRAVPEKKVVLAGFEPLNVQTPRISQTLSESLGTSLTELDFITIVERGMLDKAIQELKLSQTGLISPASQQELGKFVGADAVLSGRLFRTNNKMFLIVKLLDVESGLITATGRAEIDV